MKSRLKTRITALGLGLALVLGTGLVAGAAPALASGEENHLDAITGDAADLNVNDINSTRPGTLEVRLTRRNPNNDPRTPGITDGSTDNYTVTISKVNDVVTAGPSADFAKLGKMNVAQAREKGVTLQDTKTTGPGGIVKFTNLPLGMYLVEYAPPTTPAADYLKFYPSLVTLPYGEANASGTTQWGYGLALMPKPVEVKPLEPKAEVTTEEKPQPPQQSKIMMFLAKTGVQIAGSAALSVGLVTIGIMLMRRRRRSEES